jgi:DNA-directed RNA polymerase II subunit RPB2
MKLFPFLTLLGAVFSEVSIVHDILEKEIRIYTDAGRCCRPLYTVSERGRLRFNLTHLRQLEQEMINWNDLLNDGLVEYIDTEEEESTMIAMTINDVKRNQKAQQVV